MGAKGRIMIWKRVLGSDIVNPHGLDGKICRNEARQEVASCWHDMSGY